MRVLQSRVPAPSPELTSPVRSLGRCPVCDFRELRTDEVFHRGLLLLAECPRCEHRFTQEPLAETPPVALAPRLRTVRRNARREETAAA